MTYSLYIDKKKRVLLILLCIVIIFGSVFGSYQQAEASATVVVEGTFLYYLYITILGGATYDSYQAGKQSYELFKSENPEAYQNFKSNIGNVAKAYLDVMDTGESLSSEQALQKAGEDVGKALPEALASIWQSLNTWLDGLGSSVSVSSYNIPTLSGIPVSISATVTSNKTASSTVNGKLNRWKGSSWSYQKGNSIASFVINSLDFESNRIYYTYTLDTGYIGNGYVYGNNWGFDLAPDASIPTSPDIGFSDSFPATGFPEYSPGRDVPFPFFPPGFAHPDANGGAWGYNPGATVEVPIGDITNPDGSIAHPGDWSGPWVGGIPVPGTGVGTGAVPGDWTAGLPLTPDASIPNTGVGDNTWAGDKVIPGDIPLNPDITVPVVPVEPGEINWNPILDAGAGLKTKFPFCLPYDLISMVESFTSEGVAPSWDINFKVPNPMNRGSTQNASIKVDFEQFASFALISRIFTTAIFIIALIMASRKLIGS